MLTKCCITQLFVAQHLTSHSKSLFFLIYRFNTYFLQSIVSLFSLLKLPSQLLPELNILSFLLDKYV